jgi:putative sterol carrier protein
MKTPQSRYAPNPQWDNRKELDGFVCARGTKATSGEFCVAVKRDNHGVHIRDTKDETDTTLSFSNDEWKAFIDGVKNNEFNA